MAKNISYQGIPGAYSHIASELLFPNEKLIGHNSFEETLDSLKNGESDLCVLPIQNSIIGSINEVYDLLYKYGYSIKGEITLQISHNLLGVKGSKLTDITKVYSHPKALNQCSRFLKSKKTTSVESFDDTASAAAYINIKNNKSEAAIASLKASKIYNLKVLKKSIQNEENNFTRFVVISKTNNNWNGNKSTLVFEAAHKPGSLVNALKPLAEAGINLTHIESRPQPKKPWAYHFYLDFNHEDNPEVLKKLIKKIKPHTNSLKKLGTYKS